jgi:hypothetical protein
VQLDAAAPRRGFKAEICGAIVVPPRIPPLPSVCSAMSFVIERVCGSARSGLFMGKLATPCLLPFTRKGLPPALIHDDLKTLDVQAVIVGAGDAFEQRRYAVQMVGAARGCWKA